MRYSIDIKIMNVLVVENHCVVFLIADNHFLIVDNHFLIADNHFLIADNNLVMFLNITKFARFLKIIVYIS